MGVGNVKLVFDVWRDLPHAPFRMLTYMALRSMDGDNPPRFWGGREELAYAIGRPVPDAKDDVSKQERRTIFGAVKDTQKVLKARGAITLLQSAGPGRNAVFAINLQVSEMGGSQTPPKGSQSPPVGGAESSIGGVSDPSLGVEEQGRNKKEGRRGSAASRRGRADAPPRPETFAEFADRHRALMVRDGETLTDGDERFIADRIAEDYITYVVGDLTAAEESTRNGMLSDGAHPKAIINKIFKQRGESEADYRDAQAHLIWLPEDERDALMDEATAFAAVHYPDASHRFAVIYAARLARRSAA